MIDGPVLDRYIAAAAASVDRLPGLLRATEQRPTHRSDAQIGELFARMATDCGKVAAAYLFRSQWAYNEPEWFDHRLHLLDPDEHFNDFWTASADNVIRVLPLGGRLLDLCSGDGFYDYWFYRYRASVLAIERNAEVIALAAKHHAHPKIEYVDADILTYAYPAEAFDTVVIRGAIEHFSETDQQRIFQIARDALKPGGYFCGDTPAKRGNETKALGAHEYEWADEPEMRRMLRSIFAEDSIETSTLVSENRTTLFWRCRNS
jgi:SAM-dependent methyltransferase